MNTPSERTLGPAGWAVYLGCSWTWCIGMFLPALLIRDFGFWGFVVFAVPNVIGAGAMGWVLRSPETSRKLVEDHKAAAVLFSQVTILFHLFWISWIGSQLVKSLAVPTLPFLAVMLTLTFAAYIIAAVLNNSSPYRKQIASIVVWIISVGLLVCLALLSSATEPGTVSALELQPFSSDLLWMLPASVFGFLFCPYLDLTFHHARQSCKSPKDSRLAFGMGFGVFFFSMIILTFIYATQILGDLSAIGVWIVLYLIIHILAQLIVTVLFHNDELEKAETKPQFSLPVSGFLIFAIAATLLGLVSNAFNDYYGLFDISLGELFYRLFLTFYALIFPTYVWLNIWDIKRRCVRGTTPKSLRVTAISIALAAPFFFMGFIMFQEIYILPGMAIVLLAKLFTGDPHEPKPIAPTA